ncbi:MAG: hypothetical protein J6C84_06100 [Lachnospiraceae bacterium]|nr:hypothetical protein [Lachnospiraceae bacterium]
MEREMEYLQQLMAENKQLLAPFLKYLPWLQSSAGHSASRLYQGEGISEYSVSFPVYDGTLMNFVREASASPLMDRNYPYIYTRNRIKTHDDERKAIAAATWKDWDVLKGIFSKYVLGGRTKSVLWSEGVQEQIFYLVIKKMKEIIEYWDRPIDCR